MKIINIWDTEELTVPVEEMGEPQPHHLRGSPGDNLVELAGRICYDSLKIKKSRSSIDYHKHIIDVNHGSVQEHFNITVSFPVESHSIQMYIIPLCLADRPGTSSVLHKEDGKHTIRITANLRAIREWETFSELNNKVPPTIQKSVGDTLKKFAITQAPLATQDLDIDSLIPFDDALLVLPLYENELWLSFYMGGVSRGLCYDEETEVLTKDGWKYFKNVDISNDQFATLNLNYELEYETALNKTEENWDGDMYKVKSTMVDLLVTPNHRMLIKPVDTQKYRRQEQEFIIKQAKDLLGKRVNYKKNCVWNGETQENFILPEEYVKHGRGLRLYKERKFNMNKFLTFLGFFISEGHIYHHPGSSYQIGLSQNEGLVFDEMKSLAGELGLSYYIKNNGGNGKIICIMDHQLYIWLEKWVGRKSYNKDIPKFICDLSSDHITYFIDAYIKGDGNIHKTNGHRVIYTTSIKIANTLQELIFKTGLSASIRIDDRYLDPKKRNDQYNIYPKRRCYIVSIANENSQTPTVNNSRYQHDSIIQYNGKIYCVTVPNGTLYVRRNGIPVWSGNTHELVRHKWHTAVSQRSTRYVDESGSDWAWHPLILKYQDELDAKISKNPHWRTDTLLNTELAIRDMYDEIVEFLQKRCLEQGIDKFTSRKQARGAARGILGNALSSELIFSASLDEWQRILEQRASQHADAEIRLMANRIFEYFEENLPTIVKQYKRVSCPDGIGFGIERINNESEFLL